MPKLKDHRLRDHDLHCIQEQGYIFWSQNQDRIIKITSLIFGGLGICFMCISTGLPSSVGFSCKDEFLRLFPIFDSFNTCHISLLFSIAPVSTFYSILSHVCVMMDICI